MTKPNLTLQPSKGVVTQAAAQVYSAYVAAGRVNDEDADDWMKRAIREVYAIARAVDSSFYSDNEMPSEEQPVIEPPVE